MEQLEYNLLFRWFVGLSMDDVVWDATVFYKNRDRLLDGDIARKFMTSVLNLERSKNRYARFWQAGAGSCLGPFRLPSGPGDSPPNWGSGQGTRLELLPVL